MNEVHFQISHSCDWCEIMNAKPNNLSAITRLLSLTAIINSHTNSQTRSAPQFQDSYKPTTAIMAALNKIAATSPSRQKPSELESSIAGALYDLESNIPDMKSALRPLQFVSAREVRPPSLISSSRLVTFKTIPNVHMAHFYLLDL